MRLVEKSVLILFAEISVLMFLRVLKKRFFLERDLSIVYERIKHLTILIVFGLWVYLYHVIGFPPPPIF